MFKPPFEPMAALLLALGVASCGKASGTNDAVKGPASTGASHAATEEASSNISVMKASGNDVDDDDGYIANDDPHNYGVTRFGHAASVADRRAIAGLVKRYLAAGAAGDGAMSCTMIPRTLARHLPEEYSTPTGPAYLRSDKTCIAIMSHLFAHEHTMFVHQATSVKVVAVRIAASDGLVVLTFGSAIQRQLPVHREGGVWKVSTLLTQQLP